MAAGFGCDESRTGQHLNIRCAWQAGHGAWGRLGVTGGLADTPGSPSTRCGASTPESIDTGAMKAHSDGGDLMYIDFLIAMMSARQRQLEMVIHILEAISQTPRLDQSDELPAPGTNRRRCPSGCFRTV